MVEPPADDLSLAQDGFAENRLIILPGKMLDFVSRNKARAAHLLQPEQKIAFIVQVRGNQDNGFNNDDA
ncbi:MAG: hypothetical protein JKY68_02370 [Rhodospirillales bacterium]|nr:hypothetical protein [Rhodospirillales bacterium]